MATTCYRNYRKCDINSINIPLHFHLKTIISIIYKLFSLKTNFRGKFSFELFACKKIKSEIEIQKKLTDVVC